jgi:hypothetical protein
MQRIFGKRFAMSKIIRNFAAELQKTRGRIGSIGILIK